MSALDRKLWRNLWRSRTQALAIAMVIGVGVLLLVMMSGLVDSLEQTRLAYYNRYRLADVFAPVTRAPKFALDRIRDVEGVAAVEGRVVGSALIDVEGVAVPIYGRAVSLPTLRAPRLNDLYLADGRMLDPRRRDEILLLRGFANAHGLGPGDTLTATLHGSRRTFRIAGIAEAPEFIYSAAPGELLPDDARFAVLWMNEDTLAAAYDVEGAFNEALVALERGAHEQAVLAAIDRILEPYGGTGSYGREDHVSDRFITEEIAGLRVSSSIVPPIFMAVAAFLLNIVIARMIEAERVQVGLLKAIGYTSTEIGVHYAKFVLVIAIVGAAAGCIGGVASGQAMAGFYQVYYKFPFLLFRANPSSFAIAIGVSIASASAGGLVVLRRVFALAPAEAMRPPAPLNFAQSARLVDAIVGAFDQPSRMIIRRIARQPSRTLVAVAGITAGMAITVGMLGVLGGFENALNRSFDVVDRSDATVTFVEPLGEAALYALASVDGVLDVEPFRAVSAVLRQGTKTHRGGVTGLENEPRLNRVLSADEQSVYVREDGMLLSSALADKLAIKPGQLLTVEVREGRRPVVHIPVVGIVEIPLGAPAFIEREALNAALNEPNRVSGAYLRLDAAEADAAYEALKGMPAVAAVSRKAEARDAFQKVMDEGAGAQRFIMTAVSLVITFGIVYNSARIAFAERAHDLASLRVLGFTKGEAAYVLLGELGFVVVMALPFGTLLGMALAGAMASGFSTDLYTIPAEVRPETIGTATLAVLIAAIGSGWIVKRDVDRLDLVAALRAPE